MSFRRAVLYLLVALDDGHSLLVLLLQLLVLVLVYLIMLLNFSVVALQRDYLESGLCILVLDFIDLTHGRVHLVLEVALNVFSFSLAFLHEVLELTLKSSKLKTLIKQLLLQQRILVVLACYELDVLLNLLAELNVLLVDLLHVLVVLLCLLALVLDHDVHIVCSFKRVF